MEQIRKYIMFARCFKPKVREYIYIFPFSSIFSKIKISEAAEGALKSAYLKLRINDDGTKLKITVRQLESLIRLSEAYARLKCAPEVRS
jgi:DNA replicative helicase MCM subunit Mcm2 (Cdc46/Mcm family)